MTTDYQKQGKDFLARFGLKMSATFAGWVPPAYAQDDIHGARFLIRFARQDGQEVTFDFWNSYADSHEKQPLGKRWIKGYGRLPNGGKAPSPYDVLACISGDVNCPETFDDFCADYGYDSDSRKAEATFRSVLEFAQKLRAFFSAEELESLTEIQ